VAFLPVEFLTLMGRDGYCWAGLVCSFFAFSSFQSALTIGNFSLLKASLSGFPSQQCQFLANFAEIGFSLQSLASVTGSERSAPWQWGSCILVRPWEVSFGP
jgi:hypothetical protein